MLVDVRQNELDVAEEKLFKAIFGGTDLDAKTQWLLKFFNIDINDLIQNFENTIKPVMLDNGMVDAQMVRSLVASKYPLISNIIPPNNFRLVDIVNELLSLLKGVNK